MYSTGIVTLMPLVLPRSLVICHCGSVAVAFHCEPKVAGLISGCGSLIQMEAEHKNAHVLCFGCTLKKKQRKHMFKINPELSPLHSFWTFKIEILRLHRGVKLAFSSFIRLPCFTKDSTSYFPK